MQESYRGKVKMIYIDPPYNTGKDFVYKDNFHDNVASYKEMMGVNMKSNPETNGRYHTDWLNMMYPRLKLARNLLTDDGVIFMSIDDNEVSNLRKITDEIFGEDNFVANIIWQKKFSRSNDAQYFSTMHDYIVCFAKNTNKKE
jgi:adenine-specific DNA-methyltransferase